MKAIAIAAGEQFGIFRVLYGETIYIGDNEIPASQCT